MKKGILLPIHKKHCDNILSGKKTVEIRKTRPMVWPRTVYLYETKGTGSGLVVGQFDLNTCKGLSVVDVYTLANACVTEDELKAYMGDFSYIFAWYVDNPIRYKSPLTLESIGVNRAPQSWHYVDVDVDVDKDGVQH